jgi:hypothetical protein
MVWAFKIARTFPKSEGGKITALPVSVQKRGEQLRGLFRAAQRWVATHRAIPGSHEANQEASCPTKQHRASILIEDCDIQMSKLLSTVRAFARKCHSASGETMLLCFVVVALIMVVLHAVIAASMTGVRRKCTRKGGKAIKCYDMADHSQFGTAIVDTNTLIVLSANRCFAERYGSSASGLVGKRLPHPIASVTGGLRCAPVSIRAVKRDPQTAQFTVCGTSVGNAPVTSQRL